MAEWLKAHAWKACIPQGIQGSNPCLSASFCLTASKSSKYNKIGGLAKTIVVLIFSLIPCFCPSSTEKQYHGQKTVPRNFPVNQLFPAPASYRNLGKQRTRLLDRFTGAIPVTVRSAIRLFFLCLFVALTSAASAQTHIQFYSSKVGVPHT